MCPLLPYLPFKPQPTAIGPRSLPRTQPGTQEHTMKGCCTGNSPERSNSHPALLPIPRVVSKHRGVVLR